MKESANRSRERSAKPGALTARVSNESSGDGNLGSPTSERQMMLVRKAEHSDLLAAFDRRRAGFPFRRPLCRSRPEET